MASLMANSPYTRVCLLVRAVGEALRCPTAMTVTALITLHRYVKEIPSVVENASALLDIATACLFLASKTEEHTVKTNDLLNTIARLDQGKDVATDAMRRLFPDVLDHKMPCPQLHATGLSAVYPLCTSSEAMVTPVIIGVTQQEELRPASSGQAVQVAKTSGNGGDGAHPKGAQWLVAEEYYERKEALLKNEQKLLRVLQFNVEIQQPHQYALNLCFQADLSPACAQLSCCLLTDLLTLSAVSASVSPSSLGVGAVVAAMELLGVPSEGLVARCGCDAEEVARVCVEISRLSGPHIGD